MALDLGGFYTPEEQFEGLNKITNRLDKNNLLAQKRAEEKRSQLSSASKFLTDYLDPKDSLTGTNYDPQIVAGFNELLQEGASLAREGADINTLLMALGPKVNKLNQYSTKAKLLNQHLKDQLSKIPKNSGYDISALEREAKKSAFYNEDGTFKDINDVDIDRDWVTETVKNKPDLVTTDAGFDEFVKNSQKFVNTEDVTRYTPIGGMSRKKVKITSPNWLQSDLDEKGVFTGLVPKYEIAMDAGNPVMANFETDGEEKLAPVRMFDKKEFDSLMGSRPDIADYVRGQVKKYNPKIDLNSPQAEMLARSFVYDELNRRKAGGVEEMEVIDKPSAQQIKINLGYSPYSRGGGGSSSGEVNINDTYNIIDAEATKKKDEGKAYLQVNLLPLDAQKLVVDFASSVTGEDLTQADIKVIKDNNNKLGVYRADDNSFIGFLTPTGTNLKTQPGIKEKREVLKKEKEVQKNTPVKEKLSW